jgi:hypothetical protein
MTLKVMTSPIKFENNENFRVRCQIRLVLKTNRTTVMDMHFSVVYSGRCFKTNRTTVMDMHFSVVYSGRCFKTNRTTVLSMHFKVVQSCQIRMVLQKKSDLFWQFFGSVTFLLVFFASLAFVSLVISRFSLRSEKKFA